MNEKDFANLKPTVHIGKEGLTENIITEIQDQIKKSRIIKIRILRSAKGSSSMDKKMFAEQIAEKSDTKILDVRGNVVVVCKK